VGYFLSALFDPNLLLTFSITFLRLEFNHQHVVVQHDGVSTVNCYIDSTKYPMQKLFTGDQWDEDKVPLGDVSYDTSINGGVNTSSTYWCETGCRSGYNMLDGNPATKWDSKLWPSNDWKKSGYWSLDSHAWAKGLSYPNGWLMIFLTETTRVNRYSMMTYDTECPTAWSFEGCFTATPEDPTACTLLDEQMKPYRCYNKVNHQYNSFSEGPNLDGYFEQYMFRFKHGGTSGNGFRVRELQLFIEGEVPDQSIPVLAPLARGSSMLGGMDSGSKFFGQHHTKMNINDFRFWDRPLKDMEIRNNWMSGTYSHELPANHTGVPPGAKGLLLDYKFDPFTSMSIEPKTSTSDCLLTEDLVGGSSNPQIADSAITASSYFQSWTDTFGGSGGMRRARIDNTDDNSWCASANNNVQYIQFEFPRTRLMSAIQTAGRANQNNQFPKNYKIRFQLDGVWRWYHTGMSGTENNLEPTIFKANINNLDVVTNMLNPAVKATAVRIYVTDWSSHICMRANVFTCAAGHEGTSRFPTQSLVQDLGPEGRMPVQRYSLETSDNLCPGAWQFSGSDSGDESDAGVWTLLDSRVAEGGCADYVEQMYNVFSEGPNTQLFRFYRWQFTAKQLSSGNGYRIVNAQVYNDSLSLPTASDAVPVPVHYYDFYGSGRSLYDHASGGAGGKIHGNAALSNGLYLDGSSDYVSLAGIGGTVGRLNQTATIEIWWSQAEEKSAAGLLDFGNEAGHLSIWPDYNNGGLLISALFGGTNRCQMFNCGELGTNALKHVVLTIDGPLWSTYINGELTKTMNCGFSLHDLGVTTHNWLGDGYWSGAAGAKGTFYRMAVYDEGLSAVSVASLYNAEAATDFTSVVHALTIADSSNVYENLGVSVGASADAKAAIVSSLVHLSASKIPVGYVPRNLDHWFEQEPALKGCKHHVVLIGPMSNVQIGPQSLCPEEGCPAPLTKAIGVSRFLWSDVEGWQGMNGTYFRFVGEEDVQNHLSVLEYAQVFGIPEDGDDAWVPPGWTITIDISTAKLDILTIEGKLQFGAGYSAVCCADDPYGMTLSARHINILGGKLMAGNVMAPMTDKISIKLHGIDLVTPDGLTMFVGRSKSIWDAGTFDLYGEDRSPTMTRLQYSVAAGERVLVVSPAVPHWRVGEKIAISATSALHKMQYEASIIESVAASPDGHDESWVTVVDGFVFDHRSEIFTVGNSSNDFVDARAAVGLMTRNIRIIAEHGEQQFVPPVVETDGDGDGDAEEDTSVSEYPWSNWKKNTAQNYGLSIRTLDGEHYNDCPVQLKRGWTPDMAEFEAEGKHKFCARGPVFQGVHFENMYTNSCADKEYGMKLHNAVLKSCTFEKGQGSALPKGQNVRGCGTPEVEVTTFQMNGRLEVTNSVIYKVPGFSGTAKAGSKFFSNMVIHADIVLLGAYHRHNHASSNPSAQGPALFLSGESKCSRLSPARYSTSGLKNYDNTVMTSRYGVGLSSGCALHNHTLVGNGEGAGVGSNLDFFMGGIKAAENGLAINQRTTMMIFCVKLPLVVTEDTFRKAELQDSIIVGCRDHSEVAGCTTGFCASYKGIMFGHTKIEDVTFANFQCGPVVYTQFDDAAISGFGMGGEYEMTMKGITQVDVKKSSKMLHASETATCGIRAGVGGTNGAPVTCDAFSRPMVIDRDGTYFGEGIRSTITGATQNWPPSLKTGCGSANLADRQDCMWWMKDQPGLMDVSIDETRQGIQRSNGHGGSCTYNADWNGFECNDKMEFVSMRIKDLDHPNPPVEGAIGAGNDARISGPIGFSQVCGMNSGAAATCLDTTGATGGGFSDYLRGVSIAGPLTIEESLDSLEGFLGREDISNIFRVCYE
jgi:hypothetical protein